MESSEEGTASQEPLAIQALRCLKQGETAKELGTFWKGNKIVEGEFSISLADLQKMRKGEVYDVLKQMMPTGSEELCKKNRPRRQKRDKGDSSTNLNLNGSRSVEQEVRNHEQPGLESSSLVLAPGQDSVPVSSVGDENALESDPELETV